MAMVPLVIAANPGSASRKYALYRGKQLLAQLHFEHEAGTVVCHLQLAKAKTHKIDTGIENLAEVPSHIERILTELNVLKPDNHIQAIGLRVVAPTGYFLQDRLLDDEAISMLENLRLRAPLHITTTLEEAKKLRSVFGNVPIAAISDSRFHAQKPDYAWNYAIPLEIADEYDIKRYGYHGISLESIVQTLLDSRILEEKVVVCHLGSGSSVTALYNGISVDTTMGYSPLEGLMMATRSGNIDIAAAFDIKHALSLDDAGLEQLLNNQSGLMGISGFSDDIRTLVDAEAAGNYRASLALRMYVHKVQQAIGQMAATLDGVDSLIFTGTVGARSHIMRSRILENLGYLNLAVHETDNQKTYEPTLPTRISPRTRQKVVYVITTEEAYEISQRTKQFI